MDLHNLDSFLNGCLTLDSSWLSVIPLGVGVSLKNFVDTLHWGPMEDPLAWITPYM
jgi:hypothetical protein